MLSTVLMTSDKKKPRILVTSGEPAGIGPELVLKLCHLKPECDITIVGDPDLLSDRARLLSVSDKNINFLPIKLRTPVNPGKLDASNAEYVLEMLGTACRACLNDEYDALVTAPIQKSVINDAGIPFTGHTEYLAEKCNNAFPVMLLACPNLRVALVTTHLPLRKVPDAITKEKLEHVLRIVIDDLQNRFGIEEPVVRICGLNPHAGENGHLGNEEQEIIIPVISDFRDRGFNVSGPYPADTTFQPEQRETTDVFVCMYHDQGLPVLKTLGFGEAVNITLGLPIIRTSVDHGTALELAGTGKANCNSLLAAVEMAEEIVFYQNRKKQNLINI